jgi:hypothetical protein
VIPSRHTGAGEQHEAGRGRRGAERFAREHDEQQHLAKVRDALAEDGLEYTPDGLKAEVESIYTKLAGFTGRTPEQVRKTMEEMGVLVGEAKRCVMDSVEEHGTVPVDILVQCISEAWSEFGMFPKLVEDAIRFLVNRGELVRIGNDVSQPIG